MKGQYIQVYKRSENVKNFHMLVEDYGNTVNLDGRLSISSCCEIAVKLCRERNYKGFRIMVNKEVTSPEGNYHTIHKLTDCWKVYENSIEC